MTDKKKALYILLLLMVSADLGFKKAPVPDVFISLRDEPLGVLPKAFFISAVKDGRQERRAIAELLPVSSSGSFNNQLLYFNFEKGITENISAFFRHNLPADKSLRPVQLTIRQFKVTETQAAADKVSGRGVINLSFQYNRGPDDTVSLVDYQAAIIYSRPQNRYQDAEPVLRHLLENGISYFNTWIDKQVDSNVKLAKDVALSFDWYADDMATDTVYYSSKRPLVWNDFTTGFRSRKYDAEVFPVMGYDEEIKVAKGIVQVHILLKAYLSKESALVKEGAENDYTLNHEQRHFDIAKIAAERFKKRLKQITLPVSNYDGTINVYYLDAYREMHMLQEQYDNETAHGADHAVQNNWNTRIDYELRSK